MDIFELKFKTEKFVNLAVIFIIGFAVSEFLDIIPLERRILLLERILAYFPNSQLFILMHQIHTQELWTKYLVLLSTFILHSIVIIIILWIIFQILLQVKIRLN